MLATTSHPQVLNFWSRRRDLNSHKQLTRLPCCQLTPHLHFGDGGENCTHWFSGADPDEPYLAPSPLRSPNTPDWTRTSILFVLSEAPLANWATGAKIAKSCLSNQHVCQYPWLESNQQNLHAECSTFSVPSQGHIGVAGFEPATISSQSCCATKLRHTPLILLVGLEPTLK